MINVNEQYLQLSRHWIKQKIKNREQLVTTLSQEKGSKELLSRSTRKSPTAAIVFFALSLLIEFSIAWYFVSSKLMDKTALVATSHVPFSFTVTISPVFHLLPAGVIIVLLSTWIYFTKRTAFLPRNTLRKKSMPEKKPYSRSKTRFQSFRRFSRNVDRRYQRFSRRLADSYHRLSSTVLKIRWVSYIYKRLSSARVATRGAIITLTVFLVFFFLTYLWGYPSSIYNSVIGFYRVNPVFLNFVLQTTKIGRGLAHALPSLNSAILNGAPGFRSALENFGAGFVSPVATLDPLAKYTFFQYSAAIISAAVLLIYGEISPYFRRKS